MNIFELREAANALALDRSRPRPSIAVQQVMEERAARALQAEHERLALATQAEEARAQAVADYAAGPRFNAVTATPEERRARAAELGINPDVGAHFIQTGTNRHDHEAAYARLMARRGRADARIVVGSSMNVDRSR
ncbi:hypothetical protein J2D73_16650 [Acetobacter sacchari]|uniref:Uncharacterized protein n=1 Tax=Acetobacter sacchari TaxID=2661687 RepID=A0ABS3LZS3_9PROT|nr:hypothetical protein [Acetobacter sacchari]MBO1361416.1 hypothetical protein [Acetobacter sacchari]